MAVFFTDADTAPHPDSDIARVFRQHGLQLECHDQHFAERTPDFRWLRHCGKSGWIAVTKDQRIRFCWRAKLSIMRSGAKLFVMIGEGNTHEELAINFVQTVHRVTAMAARYKHALIARVYMAAKDQFDFGKPGQVNEWLTYDGWKRLEKVRDEAKEKGHTLRDRCG